MNLRTININIKIIIITNCQFAINYFYGKQIIFIFALKVYYLFDLKKRL